MDKTLEEKKVEKKIGQLQNQQKILLNRKRTEEHRARTHRLIERGAILETVFPPVKGPDFPSTMMLTVFKLLIES